MAGFITIGTALLGWGIGALINYLADVLPATRRLGIAVCPACQKPVPIAAYLAPRHCRGCNRRPPVRQWIVLAGSSSAAALLWYFPNERLGFLPGLLVLAYFALVAIIDIEWRLILHPVSLVGLAVGSSAGLQLHGPMPTLLGGLAGFGFMLVLYLLGGLFAKGLGRLRGQPIEEEALGFGDVALGAVLGFMLGWPGIIAGLVLAILLGGAGSLLVMVFMLARRRYQAFTPIPYGPFLVLSAVILLF